MFYNMDQLVYYINNNTAAYGKLFNAGIFVASAYIPHDIMLTGVQVKYATLGDYFDAVHAANLTWSVRG